MKVLAIISSLLILQTSASFFDELRGAVSSIENSFENLLSDVVYDVKETIDCTLLAVEQVLSLGIFGEQSEYDRRCKGAPAPVVEPPVVESEHTPPPAPEIFTQKPISELTNKESRQVDQVLCDVLKKDDAHSQLINVKLTLQTKTKRLTEINNLLRKQLKGISNEVKEKLNIIESQPSTPSVATIWNDINILHDIEHRLKNTAEAKNISHVFDQVLDILDAKEEDQTSSDEYKIKEIMHNLSQYAIDGSTDLWKSADEYPKDFREYANKIFEESRGSSSLENSTEKSEADSTNVIPKEDLKKEQPKEVTTVKPKRKKITTTTTTTEKALTVEELAAQYGSLFEIVPDIDNVASKQAANTANNIIKETKMNEIVMHALDDLESNKEAKNLFDDPIFMDTKT